MNDQAQPSSNPENELARRIEQLLRLLEVNRSVADQIELDPLLQQIVDAATQLLNAEMGGLLVLSQDVAPPLALPTRSWCWPLRTGRRLPSKTPASTPRPRDWPACESSSASPRPCTTRWRKCASPAALLPHHSDSDTCHSERLKELVLSEDSQ